MGNKGNEDLKLWLWSWAPGEKSGRVDELNSPADWNSHLSLAAIGDQLCLAYHAVPRPEDESFGVLSTARIFTVFHKAD
jgi:hypothetical protein